MKKTWFSRKKKYVYSLYSEIKLVIVVGGFVCIWYQIQNKTELKLNQQTVVSSISQRPNNGCNIKSVTDWICECAYVWVVEKSHMLTCVCVRESSEQSERNRDQPRFHIYTCTHTYAYMENLIRTDFSVWRRIKIIRQNIQKKSNRTSKYVEECENGKETDDGRHLCVVDFSATERDRTKIKLDLRWPCIGRFV